MMINKKIWRVFSVSLMLFILFLSNGYSEIIKKYGGITDIIELNKLDNKRFDEFMPGLYHNIIVLKFINPAPIGTLGHIGIPHNLPPNTAIAKRKKFVYLPSERTENDIKKLNKLKINETLIRDELHSINNILAKKDGIEFSSYFSRSGQGLKSERLTVERLSGTEAANLNNYYNIFIEDTSVADAILHSLNKFKIVEVAYFPPIPVGADIPPATPDFSGNQAYLDPAPNGIDAQAAWSLPGGNGLNVQIIDIEGDWVLDHEDMVQPFFIDNRPLLISAANLIIPELMLEGRNHGTAVIGILKARDDGHGITGIANGSDYGVVSVIRESLPEFNSSLFYRMTADAVNVAAAHLNAGDIILIEQHAPFVPGNTAFACSCNCGQHGYVAVENWQAEYDAIFSATARGIIVVEAAGNGGMNLDSSIYSGRFNRSIRDSGAIIVGAAEVNSSLVTDHNATCYSNHGSRVDVHSWGDNIWSLGYGRGERNNGTDERQWYSNSFGGTSGASAIVAGAVAAIQGARIGSNNTPLGFMDMRQLLINTGTPQSGTRHIGPQPDLSKALNSLTTHPIEDYTCSLPAEHSQECGGAACIRKKESFCWDECWFFGLFCEQECLLVLSNEYECVNQ